MEFTNIIVMELRIGQSDHLTKAERCELLRSQFAKHLVQDHSCADPAWSAHVRDMLFTVVDELVDVAVPNPSVSTGACVALLQPFTEVRSKQKQKKLRLSSHTHTLSDGHARSHADTDTLLDVFRESAYMRCRPPAGHLIDSKLCVEGFGSSLRGGHRSIAPLELN